MRKQIIALLAAGAFVVTASVAMATETNREALVKEKHIMDGTVTFSTVVGTAPAEVGGNHYFKTDMVETGRHGGGNGGFGLSTTELLNAIIEVPPIDDAYGYAAGTNPFTANNFITDPDLTLGGILAAPGYTLPCPAILNGVEVLEGSCPANANADNPQTAGTAGIWDGTVLDDVYQGVGGNDTTGSVATKDQHLRTFDQWLDQLFYNGKRGIVSLDGGLTPLEGSADGKIDTGRHYNIDDTLDQDIADWEDTNDGVENEIMGIYGKLTLIFQLASKASTTEGCASGGMGKSTNATCVDNGQDGIAYAEDFADGTNGTGLNSLLTVDKLSTAIVDQWVVSDVWDWVPARDGSGTSTATDKYAGTGMAQGYSSWFRDGSSADFDYNYEYVGGHGTINKTVDLGTEHTHPDP